MPSVTPGYTFTSTSDPITATKLNLLGQPSVTLSAGDVTQSVCSPSGIGYPTGSGKTVTQATSKSTAVTINAICGAITMNNANLASATAVVFTVNNSLVSATDTVIVNYSGGGASAGYLVGVGYVTTGVFNIIVYNCSGGALAEAIVLNFAVIKSVTS